jgi:uncharacterized protein (DUF4213/DUF364 family)
MWELYDKLIGGIPEALTADEIVRGTWFSYVKCAGSIGIGASVNYDHRMPMFSRNMEGESLRKVAELIKSWNFYEASVGLAAINAYYNSLETAKQSGMAVGDSMHVEDRVHDPFIMSQKEIRDKKVVVIGHFPYLEKLFEPVCELKIIAGEISQMGDYPDGAAEYLLPESDFIFIRCLSIVDKTLPRYLKLAEKAEKITLVGPLTPMAPILFEFGIDDLSGFVVKDPERAMRMIRGAENGKIYSTGQKVSLKKVNNSFPIR